MIVIENWSLPKSVDKLLRRLTLEERRKILSFQRKWIGSLKKAELGNSLQ